jgi:hypothetical protein
MYVCMCLTEAAEREVCVHLCMYVCIRIYAWALFECPGICVCMYCVCMGVYIHTYIHTYTHTHIYIQIYVHIYVHMLNMYMHLHTQVLEETGTRVVFDIHTHVQCTHIHAHAEHVHAHKRPGFGRNRHTSCVRRNHCLQGAAQGRGGGEFVYGSVCLCVRVSVCFCLSVCVFLSVCLYVCLYVCLSVCLSLNS